MKLQVGALNALPSIPSSFRELNSPLQGRREQLQQIQLWVAGMPYVRENINLAVLFKFSKF